MNRAVLKHPSFVPIIVITAIFIAVPESNAQVEVLKPGEVKTERLETADSNILGARATGIIEAPIDSVWKVLNDFNKFKEFMPNLRTSFIVDKAILKEIDIKQKWDREPFEKMLSKYILDQANSDTVCSYSVLDLPIVTDRWYLLKKVVDNEKHTIRWSLAQGNVNVNEGSWELQPYAKNHSQTVVIYTTYSDPGGYIPNWIIELGFTTTLEDVILGLRRRVLR
ncbi:hypothetical protein AMJ80_05355 [bacterium SM23_31]|nr:MAG: hypothetical protein AMJ80_05355 [bacterium SM23_31]